MKFWLHVKQLVELQEKQAYPKSYLHVMHDKALPVTTRVLAWHCVHLLKSHCKHRVPNKTEHCAHCPFCNKVLPEEGQKHLPSPSIEKLFEQEVHVTVLHDTHVDSYTKLHATQVLFERITLTDGVH